MDTIKVNHPAFGIIEEMYYREHGHGINFVPTPVEIADAHVYVFYDSEDENTCIIQRVWDGDNPNWKKGN